MHPITPSPLGALTAGHNALRRTVVGWRPQGSPNWLLVAITRGNARVGRPGGDLILEPGMVVLWLPGAPQDYGPAMGTAECQTRWVHFHPRDHWLPWLAWDEVGPDLRRCVPDPGLWRRFIKALATVEDDAHSGQVRAEDLARASLERALILLAPAPAAVDPGIQRAVEHLSRHLDHRVVIGDLARLAGLSRTVFCERFRDQVGLPPRAFLELRRLERARDLLLSSDATQPEIAALTGFSSAFHLSNRFKRRYGMPPGRFRQDQR